MSHRRSDHFLDGLIVALVVFVIGVAATAPRSDTERSRISVAVAKPMLGSMPIDRACVQSEGSRVTTCLRQVSTTQP